jgi:hypothetical protein
MTLMGAEVLSRIFLYILILSVPHCHWF